MPSLSVFHPGEQMVQRKTGTREQVKAAGMEDFVRTSMPSQHRTFMEQQSLLYLGSRDTRGWPWATVVAGRPGFVAAPDPQHLHINTLRLHPQDPLVNGLSPGAHVGLLAIELHTRRRNRLNGVVAPLPPLLGSTCSSGSGAAARQLHIDVSLSFGNCPKYIQGRHLSIDWEALDQHAAAGNSSGAGPQGGAQGGPQGGAQGGQSVPEAGPQGDQSVLRGGKALGVPQCEMVRGADTFFITSCYDGPAPAQVKGQSVGCDVSHRGGPPGFIQVTQLTLSGSEGEEEREASVLRWADYAGNNMFQTLGNLMTEPKAGLLIVDWQTGDTLQLTGEATVDFEDTSLPGAQRTVSFLVHDYVHIRHALPLRQVGAVDWSPFLPRATPQPTPPTPDQQQQQQQQQQEPVELLQCVSTTPESPDITTFEFRLPRGADPAAAYLPGQYATFEFPGAALAPPGAEAVVRTWTVSSHPSWTAASGTFTISVKRAGRVSGLLHRTMRPGAAAAFRSFGGDFTPRLPAPAAGQLPGSCRGGGAVLLIAGGIGITPIRAMLHELVLRAGDGGGGGGGGGAAAELAVLYAVRGLADAAFMDELAAVAAAAAAAGPRVRLALAASRATAPELAAAAARWPGATLHQGRLNRALLLECGAGAAGAPAPSLSSVRAAFMCGPPGFMSAVEEDLREAGMDMDRLFTESFAF